MSKETGGGLYVADSTRSQLTRDADCLERRGELAVRGRREPLTVWVLLGPRGSDGGEGGDGADEAPGRAAVGA